MAAFTDMDRIEDFIRRRNITSRNGLKRGFAFDRSMAAIFADDPDGSKMALADRLMAANRQVRDEAARRRADDEARLAALPAWLKPREPDPDGFDWADVGVPVDEYGEPLGVG